MTYYLAENPWYLVGGLSLVAVVCLVLLRIRQDARYLTIALVALGLAALVFVVEQVWVTEGERIEQVVLELAEAVQRSDGAKILELMDEHVDFGLPGNSLSGELNLPMLADRIKDVEFDFVHISRLSAQPPEQSRRGTADFRAFVSGRYQGQAFTASTDWQLGLRRTSSPEDRWKVTRITAVALPSYAMLSPIISFLRRPGAVPMPTGSLPFIPRPSAGTAPGFGPADHNVPRPRGR
jgi:hypothetical protein